MTFAGFAVAALDFYDDLELDNTKSYWEAHKAAYAEHVRAPMEALCAALAEEFGPAKVFRPYRDVRFAKEKSTVNAIASRFVMHLPGGIRDDYIRPEGQAREQPTKG